MKNEQLISTIASSGILKKFTPKLGNIELAVKKNSPELLLVLGLGTGVMAAVSFARGWKRHELVVTPSSDVIRNFKDEQDKLLAESNPERPPVSSDVRAKALLAMYGHLSGKLIKNYLPTVALASVSVYSILSAHSIMKGRQQVLFTALVISEQAYAAYRKRVAEKWGEDEEEQVYFGAQEQEVKKVTMVDGKKKTSKDKYLLLPEDITPDMYNVKFEAGNKHWEPLRIKNLGFLKAQENFLNSKLEVWGHVTLNDMYDALGLPRKWYGQLTGWSLHIDGDDFIDLGLNRKINLNVTTSDFVIVPNVNGSMYYAI